MIEMLLFPEVSIAVYRVKKEFEEPGVGRFLVGVVRFYKDDELSREKERLNQAMGSSIFFKEHFEFVGTLIPSSQVKE